MTGHGDLWEYKNRVARELGNWVRGVFVKPIVFTHASMRPGVLERMWRMCWARLESW